MFRFRWFHRIIRRNTKPIAEDKALLWKKRLNFMYIFFAWNAAGIGLYQYTHKDGVDEISSAKSFAKLINAENAQVIRISGFNVVKNYDISKSTNELHIKEDSKELFFNTDEVLKKVDSQESEIIFSKDN